jgi:hypothetical protein
MRDVNVTISNWEKYQFRKQIKHPSWFRVENRLWNDEQFFYFTAEERWIWICLLSIASQKQTASLCVGLEWLSRESGVGMPSIETALQKLKDNKCLDYTLHERNVCVPAGIPTRHNKTRQDITRHNISIDSDAARLSSPKKGSSNSKLIGEYIKAYQGRYKARPVIDGRTQGLVKKILTTVPEDQACDMVQAFVQMNDPWFIKKAHDFPTFYENLTKVSLALQTGEDHGAGPKKKTFEELLAEQDGEKNGSRFLQTTNRKT